MFGFAQLNLGLALGFLGHHAAAKSWLTRALASPEEERDPRMLGGVYAYLARVCLLAGDVEGSLAFQEAALHTKGSDLRQAVPLLALALCAGDESRAALASSRLHRIDLGFRIRSRFDAALSAVRNRCARNALRGWRSGRDARIRDFLRRNLGPEAEVAKLVLHR
jgi:hypothetical protein